VADHAFALADSNTELQGASMAYGPNGETVNLKALLTEGNGTIVTDDPRIVEALRGNPIFVEASAPSAPITQTPEPSPAPADISEGGEQ
jgi:hypothetical protein